MEIKKYLKSVDEISKKNGVKQTIHGFVLENGKEFKPIDLPVEFQHCIGKPKECFLNAYQMALASGYSYVEGYAIGVIPVLHAWVTEGHHAIDPTWEDGKGYIGVTFGINYVEHVIFKRKAYGVLDCLEIGFPLLTGEHVYNKRNEVVDLNGEKHNM
jgi:hypothetical protein